jgi:DNA-binding GntR family transcriptional regulator
MAPRKADAPGPAAYRTKADIARQHIQQLIRSGDARPGDHITTREISQALGMSETPVREAIRSLAAEGWLDFNAHLGVAVSSVKTGQLAEIYALRGALGATAIELGGALYTQAQLAALERNLEQAKTIVAAADAGRYVQLNTEFHTLLSDTPNTRWTLKLLTTLWAQTAAMGRGFELVPARMRRSLDEHRAILKAIRDRDYAGAAALLVEHERRGGAELIAALETSKGLRRPKG